MEPSYFMDNAVMPGKADLETALGERSSARVYSVGCGIRIPVPDQESLKDIFTLLKFKLAN